MVPLLGITGLALDMAKGEMGKSSLQASVDAAAVAGASSFKDEDRETLVETVFEQMIDDSGVTVDDFDVVFDDDLGTVEVTANGGVSTIISQIFGTDTLNLDAIAKSSFGLGKAQMDLVMCIDATGSMRQTLSAAKASARSLEQKLLKELKKREVPIEQLRARVVFYRDYNPPDWPSPMSGSQFYELPDDRGRFHHFIASERARGGYDWPEAGLECFHEAMTSDWNRPEDRYTILLPVVAIWTDAPADYAGDTANRTRGGGHYPIDMPNTDERLLAEWNDPSVIPQDFKTVVLFGPETGGWSDMKEYPGYVHGGSVTDGNEDFVGSLADAIAENVTDLPARLIF